MFNVLFCIAYVAVMMFECELKWIEYCKSPFYFMAIYFCVFVSIDIFAAIYFHTLQNWPMKIQCTAYLEHIRGNYF